ncbi:MAG TPA: hypothetical protein VF821_35515 [Lentzea sp.]
MPLAEGARGVPGWHIYTADPANRLRQRVLPYYFPLILIAVAPALVAIPLALVDPDWMGLLVKYLYKP